MMRLLRNPKHFTMYALALLVTLVLAACGGGTTVTQGELTEADAQAYASLATASASLQMELLEPVQMTAFIGSTSFGPQGITTQQDCVTVSGNQTDNDSDGIPVNATWTYNCNQSTHGIDAQGMITLADQNDSNPDAGYTMTISDDFGFSYSSGSSSISYGFSGSVTVTVTGSQYDADIDLNFEFASGGESAAFSIDYTQTYTAASDGDADPFDNGNLSFSGNITVSEGSGGSITEYSLDAATGASGLAISDTCGSTADDSGVQSGSIEYSDNAGNALVVNFTGCDATTTYTSGS